MTSAISSYTESMYEAGGGKGASTGVINKKHPLAPWQATPGAPGAPGQKYWEVLYKAQKKPRGREDSEDQATPRGRNAGGKWKTEWKVSDPVIKKDLDDAKTKEAAQQKLYKDDDKKREVLKEEQAKEVAEERKELLEEALKRIAAKEAKKEKEEEFAKHLKEVAASCHSHPWIHTNFCCSYSYGSTRVGARSRTFRITFPDLTCTPLTLSRTPLC
jgi:hypothetical protein